MLLSYPIIVQPCDIVSASTFGRKGTTQDPCDRNLETSRCAQHLRVWYVRFIPFPKVNDNIYAERLTFQNPNILEHPMSSICEPPFLFKSSFGDLTMCRQCCITTNIL